MTVTQLWAIFPIDVFFKVRRYFCKNVCGQRNVRTQQFKTPICWSQLTRVYLLYELGRDQRVDHLKWWAGKFCFTPAVRPSFDKLPLWIIVSIVNPSQSLGSEALSQSVKEYLRPDSVAPALTMKASLQYMPELSWLVEKAVIAVYHRVIFSNIHNKQNIGGTSIRVPSTPYYSVRNLSSIPEIDAADLPPVCKPWCDWCFSNGWWCQWAVHAGNGVQDGGWRGGGGLRGDVGERDSASSDSAG